MDSGALYREHAANLASVAIENPSDPRVVQATDEAVEAARRHVGLLDPPRRGDYPDPELSDEQHQQVESILRGWLRDALSEFGPTDVG
jgi:hypothetical protein